MSLPQQYGLLNKFPDARKETFYNEEKEKDEDKEAEKRAGSYGEDRSRSLKMGSFASSTRTDK